MINTWQCTPLKGTHPHSCFEGNPMDKNRAPPLVAWARKHPFHDERIFSISRSSITTRTTRFMLKSPMRWRKMFWGCTEAITLPTSWFGRRCPNRWWQIFIFAKKGLKLVSKCVKKTYYKELWNNLKWPSSVVWNGFSSISYFLSKCQDNLGVAAQEPSGLYQGQELVFGECRLQNTGQ